mmetsp:Transcript_14237/g.30331  ORF Transcript_14237/g.30331 Transcript_14237/m.30331 type:complete len:224 (-) Transcript_14237:26-697(-)
MLTPKKRTVLPKKQKAATAPKYPSTSKSPPQHCPTPKTIAVTKSNPTLAGNDGSTSRKSSTPTLSKIRPTKHVTANVSRLVRKDDVTDASLMGIRSLRRMVRCVWRVWQNWKRPVGNMLGMRVNSCSVVSRKRGWRGSWRGRWVDGGCRRRCTCRRRRPRWRVRRKMRGKRDQKRMRMTLRNERLGGLEISKERALLVNAMPKKYIKYDIVCMLLNWALRLKR